MNVDGKDWQDSDLPRGLATPAQRALAAAGIRRLEELAALSEADVTQLHGMGPTAIRQLRQALDASGLRFAERSAVPAAAVTEERGRPPVLRCGTARRRLHWRHAGAGPADDPGGGNGALPAHDPGHLPRAVVSHWIGTERRAGGREP